MENKPTNTTTTPPDLPRQPIHLLRSLPRHQNLHHLLLPPHLHHATLPMDDPRPKHSHRPLGNGDLPRLRPPMSPPPRLLGQERRRPLLRLKQILHRQPSLQRPHGLRHPGPPRAHDLEPATRLAGQARAERGLRTRRLRLLR